MQICKTNQLRYEHMKEMAEHFCSDHTGFLYKPGDPRRESYDAIVPTIQREYNQLLQKNAGIVSNEELSVFYEKHQNVYQTLDDYYKEEVKSYERIVEFKKSMYLIIILGIFIHILKIF